MNFNYKLFQLVSMCTFTILFSFIGIPYIIWCTTYGGFKEDIFYYIGTVSLVLGIICGNKGGYDGD
jgi:hypothetical protein